MKKYFIGLLVCLLYAVLCLLALPTAAVVLASLAALAVIIFVGGVLVLPMFFAYILKDWLKKKLNSYGE
jgi:hypothetical protein